MAMWIKVRELTSYEDLLAGRYGLKAKRVYSEKKKKDVIYLTLADERYEDKVRHIFTKDGVGVDAMRLYIIAKKLRERAESLESGGDGGE